MRRRDFISYCGLAIAGWRLHPERLLWEPEPNTVTFTISNLVEGDRVYVAPVDDWLNPIIHQRVIKGDAITETLSFPGPERTLAIRVRNANFQKGTAIRPFDTRLRLTDRVGRSFDPTGVRTIRASDQ